MLRRKSKRIKELEKRMAEVMCFDHNKMETYLYHVPENGVQVINHNLGTLDVLVERYDNRGNPVSSNFDTLTNDSIKIMGVNTPERIIVRRFHDKTD